MTQARSADSRGREAGELPRLRWSVWGQWTLANAIGEALGLGATLLIGILLFARLEPALGPLGPVISLVLGVVAGAAIEGSVVGTLQWIVLRQPLAGLGWLRWAAATAIGAGIAWALGFLPSTIASLMTATESTQAGGGGVALQDVSGLTSYSLAAGLGFVAGAILAVAQWWVLRRFVPHAIWWIPANGGAWALGMVLIFLGMSVIPTDAMTIATAALLVAFVVVTGGVVGATQGLALIWLLRERDREQKQTLQRMV